MSQKVIPKIIHFCWFGGGEKSKDVLEYIKTWQQLLPDYKIMEWNEKTYSIENSIPYVKEAYSSKKWAFVSDYVRLYALYNYGGIYLDCDVEVLKSFNDLLHLPYFIGEERSDDFAIEAAVVGFEKGHLLFKNMLDYYQDRPFYIKGQPGAINNWDFDILTMPIIVLDQINKHFQLKRIQTKEEFDFNPNVFCVFPADYFSPKSWKTKDLRLTSRSYSIHHFTGSWIKDSKAKLRRFRWLRFLGLFCKKYRMR